MLVCSGWVALDGESDSFEGDVVLSWRGIEASVKPAIIGAKYFRSNWTRERTAGGPSLLMAAASFFS